MAKPAHEPKKTTTPATRATNAAPAPATTPEPAKPAKAEENRLTIPLTPDGRADFGSMRDKTKDRVRKIVTDPALARELGINQDAAPKVSVLPPLFSYALLTAVNQLETIIVARITNAPMNVVLPITHFSDEEKEAVREPLDKVLNKYGGSLIGKWGDEIGLLVVLAAITMQKVEAVRQATEKNVTPRARVVPHPSAPPPAPAPEPEPPAPMPDVDAPHPSQGPQVPPDVFQ